MTYSLALLEALQWGMPAHTVPVTKRASPVPEETDPVSQAAEGVRTLLSFVMFPFRTC